MFGAIIGDIVGSPFEFDRGNKSEVFPLFSERSEPTDDSVMTCAVAEAFIRSWGKDDETIRKSLISSMLAWGEEYPFAGYGARFSSWFNNPIPYGSYGNGSAMRVSPVGWLFDNLDDVLHYAKLSAEVSHNHPEGIKGAQATAAAIFLNRRGISKNNLREYITTTFGYDLSRSLAEIRPKYFHVESCQETVPEAITAFLEGYDFEDVLRKAVSLGGDCDTLTDIAAAIAQGAYKIPGHIVEGAIAKMDDRMIECVAEFESFIERKVGPSSAPPKRARFMNNLYSANVSGVPNLCPACGKIHRSSRGVCPYCAYTLHAGEEWGCESVHVHNYIKWLQRLLGYQPYFQTRPEMPESGGYKYPTATMMQFLHDFRECKIYLNYSYRDVLGNLRLQDVTPEVISRQNIEGIICIFIYYGRGDHWVGSYNWSADGLKNGNFALLLERLKYLLSDLGIATSVEPVPFDCDANK